jgi:rhodanese-related sulfurtransferase/transcriptional regulator with XRE-family HTH domain
MKRLGPAELQALLARAGDDAIDLVDVREPSEWQTGHLPGARLVPLGLIRADVDGAAVRDPVVFVCARGGRSATAAALAEAAGRREVYSLDGGTDGWRDAGLPIVMPGAAPATGAAPREVEAPAPTPTPPLTPIEPELDALVGPNVKRVRDAAGMSLDDLARDAGVARSLLGQIELGRAVPSIGVVWKIAQALGVPFSALISTESGGGTVVSRRATAKKLTSGDGRFVSRALYPLGDPSAAEFYELWLAPHSREDAEAHEPGARENLIVTAGTLELVIGRETVTLSAGDAVNFSADQPHSYVNHRGEDCWMYLVMNYAGRRRG